MYNAHWIHSLPYSKFIELTLKFNGMETFMAIVFLVFGILQIILFFKIWGMTNNVKKIKNKLFEGDFPAEYLYEKTNLVKDAFYANIRKIDKLIYLGEKDVARRMLLSMKYDLEKCCSNADKFYAKKVQSLSEPLFKKICLLYTSPSPRDA